jgi:membrane protein implicated in regulation of membrane protease activity
MATDLLVSFHVVLIACAIVLAAGTGVWALLSHQFVLAALSLVATVALIVYRDYFERKAERTRLE